MRFIIGGNGSHHTLLLVTNLKIVRAFSVDSYSRVYLVSME